MCTLQAERVEGMCWLYSQGPLTSTALSSFLGIKVRISYLTSSPTLYDWAIQPAASWPKNTDRPSAWLYSIWWFYNTYMEFGYILFLDNFILLFFSGSLNVAHSALHVVGHDVGPWSAYKTIFDTTLFTLKWFIHGIEITVELMWWIF